MLRPSLQLIINFVLEMVNLTTFSSSLQVPKSTKCEVFRPLVLAQGTVRLLRGVEVLERLEAPNSL